MKKGIKITGVLFLVAVMAVAYVWFFVYNKPHRNFEKAKPVIVESARQSYQNFKADPRAAEAGKVIEIHGVPSGIEHSDSLVVVVFAFQKGMFGNEGVRCTVLPDFRKEAATLSLRDTVYIKGFCSGYNGTDVILEDCSIIHK
ncbi:hypothetical protein MNBD_BACTEROID07-452 [hydrothermal vent metagenome]|uniref:tRNA_anti-like n=1 Tax=hydrothermal vent metagenome TaxID=652676 RepID=A0A3B0ULM1_9ZZZZ